MPVTSNSNLCIWEAFELKLVSTPLLTTESVGAPMASEIKVPPSTVIAALDLKDKTCAVD